MREKIFDFGDKLLAKTSQIDARFFDFFDLCDDFGDVLLFEIFDKFENLLFWCKSKNLLDFFGRNLFIATNARNLIQQRNAIAKTSATLFGDDFQRFWRDFYAFIFGDESQMFTNVFFVDKVKNELLRSANDRRGEFVRISSRKDKNRVFWRLFESFEKRVEGAF